MIFKVRHKHCKWQKPLVTVENYSGLAGEISNCAMVNVSEIPANNILYIAQKYTDRVLNESLKVSFAETATMLVN